VRACAICIANLAQVRGQDDNGKAISKATSRACCAEIKDIRWASHLAYLVLRIRRDIEP